MLRPEPMDEVLLLVQNKDAQAAVEVLARVQSVHVRAHAKTTINNTQIDIGTPFAQAPQLSEGLIKTRSLLSKITTAEPGELSPHTIEDRLARIQEIASRYAQHERVIAITEEEITKLRAQLEVLERLPDVYLPTLLESTHVAHLLMRFGNKRLPVAPQLLKPLATTTIRDAVLVTVPLAEKDTVAAVLEGAGYERLDLFLLQELKGDVADLRADVRERLTVALHWKQRQLAMVARFSLHVPFLRESERILALELLKAEAPLHFGLTARVTLVRGYVPSHRVEELRTALAQEHIDAVLESVAAQNAPIQLDNPKPTRSFEELIKLYTLPSYHEIDPTSIMAITFPIFFGFMLGDIGYGLCVIALVLALRKFAPSTKAFANILFLSAISAILFGIFFGEFFGLEQIFGLHLTPVIHRMHDLKGMFTLAVLIGSAHLQLGLLLGLLNESRHGLVHAAINKGGWMLLQVAGVLLFAHYGFITLPYTGTKFHWVLAIIASAMIIYAERVRGLIELPMIISHTLSYLRLVAVGLASVALALVVNDMGAGLAARGGFWVLMGLLIIVVGHAINLALGLLGPFLHSLRLHYAEFFMKFYEGGGTAYRPFGKMEEAT